MQYTHVVKEHREGSMKATVLYEIYNVYIHVHTCMLVHYVMCQHSCTHEDLYNDAHSVSTGLSSSTHVYTLYIHVHVYGPILAWIKSCVLCITSKSSYTHLVVLGIYINSSMLTHILYICTMYIQYNVYTCIHLYLLPPWWSNIP